MTYRTIDPDPIPGTDLAAYRAWQAHVAGPRESNTFAGTLDAGRIPVPSEVEGGNRPPPDPAILASTLRTEQILRPTTNPARTGGEA